MAYIAVIGPDAQASAANIADAYEVGRLLAERHAIVITGGLGGVMEAAAKGCTAAGGTSIGLLPGIDRGTASEQLTLALPTGLGELRNGLVVRGADAIIAIGGSWGTLSELALAKRAGVSVVSLGGWGVVDAAGRRLHLETAASPSEAVDRILELTDAAS